MFLLWTNKFFQMSICVFQCCFISFKSLMNHFKRIDDNGKKIKTSANMQNLTWSGILPSWLPKLRPWPKRVMGRQFPSKCKRCSCFSVNWWFKLFRNQLFFLSHSCQIFWYLTSPCFCHLTTGRDMAQRLSNPSNKFQISLSTGGAKYDVRPVRFVMDNILKLSVLFPLDENKHERQLNLKSLLYG